MIENTWAVESADGTAVADGLDKFVARERAADLTQQKRDRLESDGKRYVHERDGYFAVDHG